MESNLLKRISKLMLVALVSTVIFSCSKDDDSLNGNGSINLKVDGSAWNASLAVQAVYDQGLFTVTGSDSNAKQVNITVLNPEEGQTYQTGGLANYSIMGRWTAGLDPNETYSTAAVTSVSGEIKFTRLTDTKAEGTFSFKARNTNQDEVSVTDGKFSVNF